ncbi:hypothetical protein, partial [Azospirillum sp. sgz302134]
APSTTETTSFSVSVNDGTGAVSSGSISTVTTSVNDAPVIGGASAGQTVNDNATVSPFASVTITDADSPAQTQTVTVTLDSAAKGALSSSGGGSYNSATGVWSYTGTASAAQAAVRALVFTPTANRVTPGSTETTTFMLSVNDGVAAAVTNNTTTVVSTSINNTPVIGGEATNQAVNDTTTVS